MQPMVAPRSLKEKQRREREALILQAAEEVLAEKGYHETSIDEIAARVGIAKGTVYLHFPSKEELVVAIFEREMRKLLALLDAAAMFEQTARGKLEAIFRVFYSAYLNTNTERRAQFPYLIHSNPELSRLFLEKKRCMHEEWNQLSTRIASLLDEGKAAGAFDRAIPTSVMLSAFFSLVSPKQYERLLSEEQVSSEEIVTHLEHLYFKGIAAV